MYTLWLTIAWQNPDLYSLIQFHKSIPTRFLKKRIQKSWIQLLCQRIWIELELAHYWGELSWKELLSICSPSELNLNWVEMGDESEKNLAAKSFWTIYKNRFFFHLFAVYVSVSGLCKRCLSYNKKWMKWIRSWIGLNFNDESRTELNWSWVGSQPTWYGMNSENWLFWSL